MRLLKTAHAVAGPELVLPAFQEVVAGSLEQFLEKSGERTGSPAFDSTALSRCASLPAKTILFYERL